MNDLNMLFSNQYSNQPIKNWRQSDAYISFLVDYWILILTELRIYDLYKISGKYHAFCLLKMKPFQLFTVKDAFFWFKLASTESDVPTKKKLKYQSQKRNDSFFFENEIGMSLQDFLSAIWAFKTLAYAWIKPLTSINIHIVDFYIPKKNALFL